MRKRSQVGPTPAEPGPPVSPAAASWSSDAPADRIASPLPDPWFGDVKQFDHPRAIESSPASSAVGASAPTHRDAVQRVIEKKEIDVGTFDPQPELDEGTPVEVTWGGELFQPLQYHGLNVGPFKVTTLVRKGETIPQAIHRVHQQIGRHVRATLLPEKLKEYLDAIEAISAAVQQRSERAR